MHNNTFLHLNSFDVTILSRQSLIIQKFLKSVTKKHYGSIDIHSMCVKLIQVNTQGYSEALCGNNMT